MTTMIPLPITPPLTIPTALAKRAEQESLMLANLHPAGRGILASIQAELANTYISAFVSDVDYAALLAKRFWQRLEAAGYGVVRTDVGVTIGW